MYRCFDSFGEESELHIDNSHKYSIIAERDCVLLEIDINIYNEIFKDLIYKNLFIKEEIIKLTKVNKKSVIKKFANKFQ